MTQGQQPEALRLAHIFDSPLPPEWPDMVAAAAELRRLHALAMELSEQLSGSKDRISELESQLEAIGAGGVEPLRRRECLHQIAEPAAATRHGIAAWMTPEGDRIVTEATMAGARKNGGAILSSLRSYSVALVRAESTKEEAANPGFLTEFNKINGLPAGEYLALPEPAFRLFWDGGKGCYRVTEPGIEDVQVYTDADMRAYVDADRAMRAQAAPAAVAGPSEADLPDVEDMAHSAVQEAMSFGVSHDVFHRWMRAVMDKTVAAILAAAPTAQAAPAAVAPLGEYPHEQMDAMALARYKVVPSDASMFWSHMVVAGDGTQQLYFGRDVECQNVARKLAGAFLDGAFAFHSIAAAPATQAVPAAQGDAEDAARYRCIRRGQHWSVIDGIGNELRSEALDTATDAARKQGANHD